VELFNVLVELGTRKRHLKAPENHEKGSPWVHAMDEIRRNKLMDETNR